MSNAGNSSAGANAPDHSAASLPVLIARGQVCQSLREKKMFYQPVGGPEGSMEITVAPAAPSGPFWCALTQTLAGPDGGVADAETCRPGRSCCETA